MPRGRPGTRQQQEEPSALEALRPQIRQWWRELSTDRKVDLHRAMGWPVPAKYAIQLEKLETPMDDILDRVLP